MVDLSAAPIVDAHCHPFRSEDLLSRDPATFETRCMMAGACFLSTNEPDQTRWPEVDALTESTVYGLAMRRWLATYLGCEPSKDAVAAARDAALRSDPGVYVKGLLDDVGIVAVLSDEGFPQPPIMPEDFEAAIGVPVCRVVRIEPLIVARREGSFEDLVGGLEADLEEAATDPRCVAFKTVIAYRTGLDVGPVEADEAARAFERWRDGGWREDRHDAKPVRDFLLRRALEVAGRTGRPLHVHCGGGDPDIDLAHASPRDLFPLLVDHQAQPIVLIHSGWPWVSEAAYVAAVLPNVHLDLSEMIPWGFSQVEWALEQIVGTVPASKVMFGSDEATEPEMFWTAAKLARPALERVLGGFVERDYLTLEQAERLGADVLAGNCLRLHGIALGAS